MKFSISVQQWVTKGLQDKGGQLQQYYYIFQTSFFQSELQEKIALQIFILRRAEWNPVLAPLLLGMQDV